jgi:hypothetical protein
MVPLPGDTSDSPVIRRSTITVVMELTFPIPIKIGGLQVAVEQKYRHVTPNSEAELVTGLKD